MRTVDRGAARLVSLIQPFFHGGWGDRGLIEEFIELSRHKPPDNDIDVRWTLHAGGALRVADGEFLSPGPHLPEECRAAHLRLVAPAQRADRVVVLMSAWNDHGYRTRSRLANRLARHGVASAMLENPFFGVRRPGRDGHPVATVADFFVMGYAAAREGIALAAHLARSGGPGLAAERRIGVSGFSMGGNIAAFVSTMAPLPVATAPLAASHSPQPVFLDGAMRAAIDWAALANGDDPEARLGRYLGGLSVLHYPPPPHVRHAVLVAGRNDAYVPPEAVTTLHDHWPGSELRWTREGHATLRFLRLPTLVQAILDSFDRLEAG